MACFLRLPGPAVASPSFLVFHGLVSMACVFSCFGSVFLEASALCQRWGAVAVGGAAPWWSRARALLAQALVICAILGRLLGIVMLSFSQLDGEGPQKIVVEIKW